jgi:hypothetical protein
MTNSSGDSEYFTGKITGIYYNSVTFSLTSGRLNGTYNIKGGWMGLANA